MSVLDERAGEREHRKRERDLGVDMMGKQMEHRLLQQRFVKNIGLVIPVCDHELLQSYENILM